MSGFWLHRFVCSVCGYRCRTWERMGAHRQACGPLIRERVCQELAEALRTAHNPITNPLRILVRGNGVARTMDVADWIESFGASPGGE